MSKNRRQAVRHGYIVIDKPAGWTSHDVVARVRRIVDERRVGHAGTLDPAALGVLPVAVGLATRTVEYLAVASKAYEATITFGVTTDSADGDGTVTGSSDPSALTPAELEMALESFRGEIQQRPPMHSAIKVNGKRLYELARQGIEIDLEPRRIVIHEIRIVDWNNPVLRIDVECSKGTYIRSLARDLGEAVGTGAHLSHLVRTRTGPFTLSDAITLDELATAIQERGWERISFRPDAVLEHLTAIALMPDQVTDWFHGKTIQFNALDNASGTIRAYDENGRWLGVGQVDAETESVRPVKVISTE